MVTRFAEFTNHIVTREVSQRMLLCQYWRAQDIFGDWTVFHYNMTQGKVAQELQDLFADWVDETAPRVNSLYRVIMRTLKLNPVLECNQAAFCLKPIPTPVLKDINSFLFRLLLTSCHRVRITETYTNVKALAIEFNQGGREDYLSCTPA